MADPGFYFLHHGMYVPKFFYTPESLMKWEEWEECTFRSDDVIVATYPKSDFYLELSILSSDNATIQERSRQHDVPVYFKPGNTLRQKLVHPKDKMPTQKQSNVVYEIQCSETKCKERYIGTNWMLEMVALVLSGGDPSLVDSVPTWERSAGVGSEKALSMNLETWPSPRVFATHFHYGAMPKSFHQVKPKVINVMRNPKDVLVSAFHYYGNVEYHATPSTLTEFLHKFLKGHVPYGSWFDHVKSWLNTVDKSHILYLTYEEMLQDLQLAVKRTAEFLEKPLEDEVIERIADRCLFKNMKKNNMKNNTSKYLDHSKFLRKGMAGDWKKHLSEEDTQLFDTVYKEKMENVDFKLMWD